MRGWSKKSTWVGALSALALFVALPSDVQSETMGPYSIGFNLNFPTTAGETSQVLKNGFGFGLDFAYRPETSPLGLRLDVTHGSFDLTSDVLKQINLADTGWASYWGFNLSALLTTRTSGRIRPYLQAGPGIYHERAEASRFAGGGGVVCDPWFGCWNVSNSEDVADWSTWRMGWMGGGGLNVEFDSGGALFFQAQYHLISNEHKDAEIIPLALGYRQSF